MTPNVRKLADAAADAAFFAAVDVLRGSSVETLRIISAEGAQHGRTNLVCSAADHLLDEMQAGA